MTKHEAFSKAKTMSINAKCSDLCYVTLNDENGDELMEHDGYVPIFNNCGGDYVDLTIDLETGKIIGWTNPTKEKLFKLTFLDT